MDKKKIRNMMRFVGSLLFFCLYIPHFLLLVLSPGSVRKLVRSDLAVLEYQIGFRLPVIFQLLYHLHNNRYYRVLFYHRLGPVKSVLVEWYRPGDRYFRMRSGMPVGEGMWIAHPYATILNANSIGNNFRCIHCTTIGSTGKGIPTIGDNVTLGASVTVIGNVTIGNNVIIGAGSVVVKDIPSNCVAVGNPCKPVKMLGND